MTVYLSHSAGEQLHEIIDYLENRWSAKVRDNFITKIHRSMETIAQHPYGFPESKGFPGLRKCVVTSQTIAYYRVDESRKEVEIITIIDSRQNLG